MKLRVAILLTASACVLGACANALPAPRKSSAAQPVPEELARRLEGVRTERGEFPSFRDIPVAPTDVRTPGQFRAAVQAVKGQGAALAGWATANPAEISDVERYAAEARRQLGVGPEDIPPPDQAAQIETLARELRRRAEPPPPIPD